MLLPASTTLLPSALLSGLEYIQSGSWNFTVNQGGYASPAGASGIPGIGGVVVNLDAGYVRLVGGSSSDNAQLAPPQVADGTLNIDAKWIDLQAAMPPAMALDANFISGGAIRLLPDNYGGYANGNGQVRGTNQTQIIFGGALITAGNLTLKAAISLSGHQYPVPAGIDRNSGCDGNLDRR